MAANLKAVAALALTVVSTPSLLVIEAAASENGYRHTPYQSMPTTIIQVATLEALALPGGPAVVEDGPSVYAASLAAADPDLARRVSEALADGALPSTLLDEARTALTQGQTSDALDAAVAARLLLSEDGVAEHYERIAEGEDDEDHTLGQQAEVSEVGRVSEIGKVSKLGDDGDVDEGASYTFARAALARASVIIRRAQPRLEPAARNDADTLLARLAALLPEDPKQRTIEPAETAETHAQGLVALLELAVDAELYVDRVLATAIDTVRHLVDRGCGASDALLGRETLTIAARYQEESLSSTLSLLAPEAAAKADNAFSHLIVHGPETRACRALSDALGEAQRTVFPEVAG